MKIAVINETSAADRNEDILSALNETNHDILNIGMKKSFQKPELTYIHTGFMAAFLLNFGYIDYVIGGCGTGQGFYMSVMQYPGIYCGLITSPLDAWLFTQINAGNCISLRLNQGYGWASNENLKFIFEKLFGVESGKGYPPHRQESQQESLRVLKAVNKYTHKSFTEILKILPTEIIEQSLNYPGITDVLDDESVLKKTKVVSELIQHYRK